MSAAVVETWRMKAGADQWRHVITVETRHRHPGTCDHRWRATSAVTDGSVFMCDGVRMIPGRYELCIGCGAACARDPQTNRIDMYDCYPVSAEGGLVERPAA